MYESKEGLGLNSRGRLIQYLRASNLTAAELARRSGVSKQTISDWLSGVQPRSIPQLKKVADVFNVKLDDLLFESTPIEHGSKGLKESFGRVSSGGSDRTIAFSLCFDGFLQRCTPRLNDHLGWSVVELASRPFMEFVHCDDLRRTHLNMIERPRFETTVQAVDTRFLSKDAGIKWMRWNAIELALHEEGLIYVACEDVSFFYPKEPEREEARSLYRVAMDAVANCMQNPAFQRIKYELPNHSSGLVVECFPAQMSAVILGVLNQASLAVVGADDATIRLDLLEGERDLQIEIITSKGSDKESSFLPNLDVPFSLIQKQSGSVTFSSSNDRLQFSIAAPKRRF
jgi:transcriptional regulator with XRE-family HTH domain